jgi:hypothetical protein
MMSSQLLTHKTLNFWAILIRLLKKRTISLSIAIHKDNLADSLIAAVAMVFALLIFAKQYRVPFAV